MLETRDQTSKESSPFYLILHLNKIYNVILNALAFRIFTFVIHSVRRICARRPSALATGGGTWHTILSTNAPHTAAVRRTVASD